MSLQMDCTEKLLHCIVLVKSTLRDHIKLFKYVKNMSEKVFVMVKLVNLYICLS